MAIEKELLITDTVPAGEDLSAKQFYWVKRDASGNLVVCTGTTDKPYGVLQNAPVSGGAAVVCLLGMSKVSADAALAVDDLIGTSADGQSAPYVAGTDTTKYLCGRVTVAAGAAGRIGSAWINTVSLHRGA